MNRLITVIIPFYNGFDFMIELVEKTLICLHENQRKVKVIIVNDSGSQSSADTLEAMFENHDEVELIHLSQNFGQHVATFIGLLNVDEGDVLTIDEDLKYSPEDIPLLLEKQEENDVVYGFIPRNGLAEVPRDFILGVIKPMLSNRYPSNTSSFRLISSDFVAGLKQLRPNHIQLEGMIIPNAKRYGIVEVKDGSSHGRKGGYSLLSLYLMLSGLITHYTLIPWIGMSVIILALIPLSVNQKMWQFGLMCLLGLFAIVNIYGEIKNISRKRGAKKEFKRLGIDL